MENTCIKCKYFSEEAFGDGRLDLENGMICSCEDSEYYDQHVKPKNSCEYWVSENEGSILSYRCGDCNFAWEINDSVEDYPEICPECDSDNIQEI